MTRRLMAIAHSSPLDFLISPCHAAQALGVEATVRMGDVGPGEPEDAWVALEVPRGELGQLAVVVCRQVVADLAKLLVDDVEVVDQPFGGRGDRAFLRDRAREGPVRLEQDAAVLGDPGPDRAAAARLARDRLCGGE
jgi:hypothetical protein